MEGRITNLQSQLRDHLGALRGRQLPAPQEHGGAEDGEESGPDDGPDGAPSS